MPNKTDTPASLLKEEQQATLGLLSSLQQEQVALLQSNNALTPEIITIKAETISLMAHFAEKRHTILESLGFEASEQGMQSWIDQDGNADILSTWKQILETATAARELNRLNGMLISKQLAFNQNTLDILQGKPLGGSNFYGPDGQSNLKPGGRTLGIG
ncbi:flagellar protein FlgN [Herbaspirillum sp. RTI4]|uniref:flagella synthesis protein FlgN n=1 Tax=Herbaspirillum sp. RTI4 TaxID=3048640 RepID=UPI002AB4997D|nr:flagellar protein FlgN [Herbaspirillum sp. RTI4]MDY7578293.1 flagellar protein FlgN [Herbaspirillum sp. RTI4]MEA9981214.1 flagellar protein FlgN [Herbaspirillum sp. RTI4]